MPLIFVQLRKHFCSLERVMVYKNVLSGTSTWIQDPVSVLYPVKYQTLLLLTTTDTLQLEQPNKLMCLPEKVHLIIICMYL